MNLGAQEIVTLLLLGLLLVIVLVFLIRRGLLGPPKLPDEDDKK